MKPRIKLLLSSCALLVLGNLAPAGADTATGGRGMIATVHPLASQAGHAAFQGGGNAVDAAVAAALTLGVVDGHNSGLGGGCFVLARLASGQLVAIDGRETAPAAASRDMFVRDGQAVAELSRHGPLAVGVPGALAAYQKTVRRYGKLPLKDSLERAARIAETGFPLDRVYARNLQETADRLRSYPASREMFLKPDGSSYKQEDILRLPDLARTYRHIANEGATWFYAGPFAEAVADWMQEHGGLLTVDDFRRYRAVDRSPIVTSYRGYQVVGFPPPSSGGIHVAQILNILECFPLKRLLREQPVTAYHVIAEAMKFAFADRAYWLGDADFVDVPRGLTDERYARALAGKIDLRQATKVDQHGLPPAWETNVFGKHTTHVAAADAEGNWVAITATVNTSFGSKVVVPGTGIVLNNEMDDFSARPGAANVFGLIGAEANSIAPGKRPLSSMSPTILLRDGRPVLTLGAAGGPRIITQVVLAIAHFVDGGQPLRQSVAQARLHHQWRPNRLILERSFSPEVATGLRRLGHALEQVATSGVTQAISRADDGTFTGVADPRAPGSAVGID